MNMIHTSIHEPVPAHANCGVRIGSYYIRGFLQGALQKGHKPGPILIKSGISPSVYNDPNATISGEQLQWLILTLRETLNDHYMGFLQVPGKLVMDAQAGRTAVNSETFGEGIRKLFEFINAVRSDENRHCIIKGSNNDCALAFRFTGFNEGTDPHLLYWFRMHWGFKFCCWLIGQRIRLTKVYFSSQQPVNGIDYQQFFNCAVEFGHAEDRMYFDQHYLVAPVIRNEAELFSGAFPLNYPDWFAIPGHEQSFSSQVEQILVELHKEKLLSPSLDLISNIMSMSSRTLSRKLGREKESFQKIKSKVRSNFAKKLLIESDIPVTHIAAKVGFSEPGDFTRAFIGWTGETPSAYRALNQ